MQRLLTLLMMSLPILGISQITTFPYFEDFESGPGGWSSATLVGGDSWNLGTPDGTVINQAAPGGTMSWYVDTLNTGINEQSHVISPVFDFTNVPYPSVELDIWWDLVYDSDGAVFQSSIDGGSSWQNVGHHDDDLVLWPNWYNHDFLSMGFPNGGAGSQNISHWTGDDTLGTQGWVTAKRALDGLGGEPSVMLRMAWINKTNNLNHPANGIAFDNVRVTNLPAVDLAVTDVSQAGPCGGGYPGQAVVTISNFGAESTTTDLLQDSAGTGFPIPSTTVPGFGSAQVIVELPLQNPGDTALAVGVVHPGDENPDNNFLLGTFDCNVINALGHCNDFETPANGPWFPDPEGPNSSWGLGPNSTNQTINTPFSGSNFWGTTGPGGGYNPNEQSSIVSPFFDFSNLQNSGISIQLWTDLETDYDGGVLQYSLDGGSTWFNVGTQGTGTNWYNAGALSGGGAGGQNAANWNGATGGWVNATNVTPMLDGAANVLFRVSIGADDIFQDAGIGLDDFCTTAEEATASDTLNIVINEVRAYPDSAIDYTVEIFNKESFDVVLDGYTVRIYDGSQSALFALSGTIASMGYKLIDVEDETASILYNKISLSNSEDVLLDELALDIDGLGYLDPTEETFYEELDTNFYRSISRIANGQDTDDNAEDFKLVCPTLGSANMDDQLSCGPPEILINEIDAQPGASGYTVELYNKSPFEADLGGYIIQVYDGNSLVNQTLFGTISGLGYKLVTINSANANISQNTINLFDSSENFLGQVTLNNAGATLYEQQGSFNELDLYVSESISRIPNGQNTFDNAVDFKIVCQTLGSENIDTSQDCQPGGILDAYEPGLILYPNPARDYIKLEIGNLDLFNLKVADATGRISNISRTLGEGRIDISALIPGIYSIIATGPNGKSAIGRFIKQ